jgi:hypothetical protein
MRPRLKLSDNEYLFMDVYQYRYIENKKIAIGRLKRYRFYYVDTELDDIKITSDISIDEISEFERKNDLMYIDIDKDSIKD